MAKNALGRHIELIVIGGSAGSLEVLLEALLQLDRKMKLPIILVVHRKSYADSLLAELLQVKAGRDVHEAEEKEKIKSNTIYLAPPDYHLLVERDKTFSLDDSEKINYSRPSIDITFQSAADIYGKHLCCILLSGANADGVEGMKDVKAAGGFCVIQDPLTAEVAYMPQQAVNSKVGDLIVDGKNLAAFLNTFST